MVFTKIFLLFSALIAVSECVSIRHHHHHGQDTTENALMDMVLSRSNDQLAIRLMEILETTGDNEPKNIFISPSSINTVLLMVLAGSSSQTHMELYKVLGFLPWRCTDKQIFETYRHITDNLNQHLENSENILEIANIMAIQKEFSILQNFSKNMTEYFKTQVKVYDFQKESHKSTEDLNELISSLTHEIIKKFYQKDLDSNTVMILLNAIYFKGQWQFKFDPKKTKTDVFQMNQDHFVSVEMMHIDGNFNYSNTQDGQMIELPYDKENLAMYIFLPHETENDHHSLTSHFQHKSLNERIDEMKNTTVTLLMPKFKIENSYSLREALQAIGIREIFTNQADLSRINGQKNLFVSEINHKTFIEVSEEGTKATAVTDGQINFRSLRQTIRIDRPFIFFIRDKINQFTIFSGIVNHPQN